MMWFEDFGWILFVLPIIVLAIRQKWEWQTRPRPKREPITYPRIVGDEGVYGKVFYKMDGKTTFVSDFELAIVEIDPRVYQIWYMDYCKQNNIRDDRAR